MHKVDWKDNDWSEVEVNHTSSNIQEILFTELCPTFYLGWVSLLYKKYRFGEWKGKVPNVSTFDELEYLMWDNETYCLFHKKHPKFGTGIIECGNPYKSQVFEFFDYSILEDVFEALDFNKEIPNIPRYFANVEDRHDFKNGQHMWDEEEA